ncbi:hypothetical protein AHAS_Ahas17G0136700 [Arachis hypogaea]
MNVNSEESDEKYVANSNYSSSSKDKEEFVPKTPVNKTVQYLFAPKQVPELSAVASHYHTLNLDAMHEKTQFSNIGGYDYNIDGGVEFRIGHRFKSREAIILGVKNYSI